jgi:phosphopantetheinyl transferase
MIPRMGDSAERRSFPEVILRAWHQRDRGRLAGAIAVGEAHLWRARVTAVTEPLRVDCLGASEQQRARRLMVAARREAFTFAHAMARMVLGAYLQVDPVRLRFEVTSEGKPYLPGQRLQFNLSHSGDAALLAIACGREVGVDLEASDRKLDIDALARASMCEAERLSFDVLEPARRRRTIFQAWTRKEALLKAQGIGLARDPRDLRLPDATEPSMPAHLQHVGRTWTLVDVPLDDAWQASLAVEGKVSAVRGYCLGW